MLRVVPDATYAKDCSAPIAVANAWAAIFCVVVNMKNTKKIALAGVLTALCFVFLYIGSLFQTMDLSAAAIGSIVILIAFIELGKKWAFYIYVSSAILSILLLPYKSPAAVFALFAGFYPILKESLNRIKPIFLSYVARIAVFNVALILLVLVFKKLLAIEADYAKLEMAIFGLANITFLVYDFALERIAATYFTRLKPLIFGKR